MWGSGGQRSPPGLLFWAPEKFGLGAGVANSLLVPFKPVGLPPSVASLEPGSGPPAAAGALPAPLRASDRRLLLTRAFASILVVFLGTGWAPGVRPVGAWGQRCRAAILPALCARSRGACSPDHPASTGGGGGSEGDSSPPPASCACLSCPPRPACPDDDRGTRRSSAQVTRWVVVQDPRGGSFREPPHSADRKRGSAGRTR